MRRKFYDPPAPENPNTDDSTWELPTEFDEFEVPEFPIESLPDVIQRYVCELASTFQVPVDIPAAAAVGILSAAVARKCGVAVGSTHREALNLYIAPTASSGERKSVIRELVGPIHEVERELRETAAPKIAEAQSKRNVAEERIKKLEKDAAKEDDSFERDRMTKEVCDLRDNLPEVPAVPQLTADDATPEYLGKLLAEQNERIAVISEEAGSLFAQVGGKYSKNGNSDLDLWLKSYDGGSVRVGRISRDPVWLESPAITAIVTPQPTLLNGLAQHPEFVGRGFIARWLFALPRSRVGTRKYQNRAIDPEARDDYTETIKSLARLPVPAADQIPVVRIEGDALDEWAKYHDRFEREQADGGRLEHMRDWASKLGGKVARIAACFHLFGHRADAEPWAKPISSKNVIRAWALGEYFLEHALAVYALMGADPDIAKARRILGWIKKERRSAFSRRECHQALRSMGEARQFDPWLGILDARGFIRQVQQQGVGKKSGRPASPRWEVNPLTQKPQNTQNPPSVSSFEDSEVFEAGVPR